MEENQNLFDPEKYNEDKKNIISSSENVSTERRDLCQDITLDYVPENLDEIEIQIDRLKQRWSEFTYLIGQRLKIINDSKLFEEKGYQDFHTYVNIALKMSENNAYYYISIFEFFTEEQTKNAGSKLKLIIPILNKVKKDKEMPPEIKKERLKNLRDELYTKIFNKTYREAEKIINEIKGKYFIELEKIESFERVIIKDDKIIIFENDKDIQDQLLKLINEFYK
jgi:hypothetical protein